MRIFYTEEIGKGKEEQMVKSKLDDGILFTVADGVVQVAISPTSVQLLSIQGDRWRVDMAPNMALFAENKWSPVLTNSGLIAFQFTL